MRTVSLILTFVSAVMLVVLIRRAMHGMPGPRTWAFAACTLIVIVASYLTWKRGEVTPPPRPPGSSSL